MLTTKINIKMKTTLQIIITTAMILSAGYYAKGQSGIYMNLPDYKNNKLAYESDCNTEKSKIRLHDFFYNAPTVTVIHGGKKYVLNKNEVYGFRDCDNEVYRFFKNEVYRLAEAGEIYIYIYTQTQNITQTKGYKVVNVYYFSVTVDGNVVPLNMGNLKNAYRNNDKFLDMLDTHFGNSEVSEYDPIHKTYKINYLYKKSINK